MSLEQRATLDAPAPEPTPERALFERIRVSPEFSRSPRLRKLFEYLCEQSIAGPGVPLTEERIGVEVFGRVRGYDTNSDTIVRVQVSQLRKKLEHYFLSDGAAEPIVIDLPRRSYTAVFRLREQPAVEKELPKPVESPLNWRTVSVCLAMLLVACLLSAGWLVKENRRLGGPVSTGSIGTPYRDHFWSELFRGGRQTQLVTSDANVMVLGDFLGRTLTPAEYIGSGYPNNLIDAELKDPVARQVLKRTTSNFVTNMPDLRVASRISTIAGELGGRLNLFFARDFRYQPQTPDNLIFLSHKKANPWVSLFEERMNFRYEFNPKENGAAIINVAPKPGEDKRYPVDWGVLTYAVIAHLRKPVGEGTVLVLEAADVVGTEADCHLLTDETRLKALYSRLGLTTTGPLPEFEVLLRAKQLRGIVREYEIIAHRIHAQ